MPKLPVLTGMPDFHDSVEYLRHQHHLSRESAAHQAGISGSYLHQLIRKRTTPSPRIFAKLADSFDLDTAQRQHLHDLCQPSAALPPAAELRRHLTEFGVQHHLDHLDAQEVLGAYFDPLQTVLYGNRLFHRVMPGLAEADDNILLWILSPAGRDTMEDWEDELRYVVTLVRAALGRYRDLPRARTLFRTLRTHPDFRRVWDCTPMQVTYRWSRSAPTGIRVPGANKHLSLSFEVDEYSACPDILITHGLYSTPAIAC
ncbi:MmyB family transcriptional regulator [Nocardia brevicatena]|uniref:MmyB family transcriptional regulator n=1 Tax=Nocardia brevicatena TaxID=37327 RepID=UPI000308528E|nr:helix-turn-helix domain-containing protein [Nocardia brevicatena]